MSAVVVAGVHGDVHVVLVVDVAVTFQRRCSHAVNSIPTLNTVNWRLCEHRQLEAMWTPSTEGYVNTANWRLCEHRQLKAM